MVSEEEIEYLMQDICMMGPTAGVTSYYPVYLVDPGPPDLPF